MNANNPDKRTVTKKSNQTNLSLWIVRVVIRLLLTLEACRRAGIVVVSARQLKPIKVTDVNCYYKSSSVLRLLDTLLIVVHKMRIYCRNPDCRPTVYKQPPNCSNAYSVSYFGTSISLSEGSQPFFILSISSSKYFFTPCCVMSIQTTLSIGMYSS